MDNNQFKNDITSIQNMVNQLEQAEKNNKQMLEKLAQAEENAANILSQISNQVKQLEQQIEANSLSSSTNPDSLLKNKNLDVNNNNFQYTNYI